MQYLKQNEGKKFSIKELFIYVKDRPKLIMGACLVPLGLFSYMAYLYLKTGDGLAFIHIQRAWGGGEHTIFEVIFDALKSIQDFNFYHAIWAIWGFVSVYHLFKDKRYDEALVSLILLIIPLSIKIQSIPRYLVGSFFPVVSMCDMIEKKNNFEIGTFL